MSKKAICVVYDTYLDVKNDPEIRDGMMCVLLGREYVNDGYNGLYKIITKRSVNTNTIPGFDLGPSSPYYAKLITDTNISEVLKQLKIDVSEALYDIGIMQRQMSSEISNISDKVDNILNSTGEIIKKYDLSGDGLVVVYLLADHRKFLSITTQSTLDVTYSVPVTNETNWMLPREFILTPNTRIINDQIGIIDYDIQTQSLLFRLKVDVAREYLIVEY